MPLNLVEKRNRAAIQTIRRVKQFIGLNCFRYAKMSY